jgi:LmbE family N-acetylglucosaminyl deacetylase
MADWKTELTGRVLVLVAHADDESVAYGALLQKMREPTVVIATDGCPRDEYFWGRFGSREAYREVRREEARQAMQAVGVGAPVLLADEDARLEDQRLFLNLDVAWALLLPMAEKTKPEAIATLAYEGGHPDHDSCSLLSARLGKRLGVPVWETAVYSRGAAAPGEVGPPMVQRFLVESGEEAAVAISEAELERKRRMCAQYASQGDFLQIFDARREVVRPQIKYDYSRAPHAGRTNYEEWQWWMSAQQVCAKFSEFVEGR